MESQCQSCPVVRFQYQRSFPQQGPKRLDYSTRGLPFIIRSGFPYTVHPDPSSPSPLERARRSVLSCSVCCCWAPGSVASAIPASGRVSLSLTLLPFAFVLPFLFPLRVVAASPTPVVLPMGVVCPSFPPVRSTR